MIEVQQESSAVLWCGPQSTEPSLHLRQQTASDVSCTQSGTRSSTPHTDTLRSQIRSGLETQEIPSHPIPSQVYFNWRINVGSTPRFDSIENFSVYWRGEDEIISEEIALISYRIFFAETALNTWLSSVTK